VRDHVDDVVAVPEDEIEAAMRFLVREHGLVAEGAGAAATAAVLAGRVQRRGRTVALVTGRNIDAATLARILSAK
jgi:threonine dehydratase